jgi:superfamily II DNA helicase RecQ
LGGTIHGRPIGEGRTGKGRTRTSTGTKGPTSTSALPAANRELYDLLKTKRKLMADEADVPPYVIFPDRTLLDMASRLPRSESDFLDLHGVGRIKAEKYADVFLPIVRAWARERGL